MLENQKARLLVRDRDREGKKGLEGKTLCGKLGGEGINMQADSIMLHPVTGWWDYVAKV